MIDSGYEETKNYLDMRYHKNESEEYENEEFMYETFSSLGELLSYCCYRGDKQWFERVYQLIEKSTAPNRKELMQQAQELRALYFNSGSHSPKNYPQDDNSLTFLEMRYFSLTHRTKEKTIKFY